MMKNFSKIILSILVLAILFSFTGCNEDVVVGNVNDEKLLMSEFKYFLENTKALMLMEKGISANSEDNRSKIKKYWKIKKNQTKARTKAFNDLVKFKLQYANAKKNDFKLSKKDETDFNNSFEQSYEGDVNFKSKLEENLGITINKFKELTYNKFYVSKYEEQETERTKVEDAEIEKYYKKNRDKFDSTTVRHVLFLTQDRTDKEKKEAKKKAEDILKKVQDGEDMVKLAEENSEDAGVIENKGEFEVKKDSEMVKPFKDWSVSANIGDTGIVKTDYGYHVMRCEEKSTFENVKNEVKKVVQKGKYLKEIENLRNDKNNKIKKNQSEIDKVKFK